LPGCGCIEYHEAFIGRADADSFLRTLWEELEWSQREIMLFGRRVMQPRLLAWYGDPVARYRYSGLTLEPLPWHPVLSELKHRIESFAHRRFNSVLANAYRDGQDSMGWHRDDEKELGERPFIASLSFGAERRFLLREDDRPSWPIVLGHGSLLVMKDDAQMRFRHALPKTRRAVGLRINLTYREIRAQAPV
jgi:alkylated DNA repair dioxygenase AlkB